MKKICLRKIIASALALAVTAAIPAAIPAQETVSADSGTTIELTDNDMELNPAIAVQGALDKARSKATGSDPYTVKLPSGKTYKLYSALKVFSNTTLDLNGSTLMMETEGDAYNMIHIGSYDTDTTGVTGYNGYENITIKNGTLDGDGHSSTLLKGAHATNVKIDNMTLRHTVHTHLSEFAAIDKLTITDCSFSDMKLTGDNETFYEAIQLDILVPKHFGLYHAEPLPVKNVKVSGCKFTNVPRAVGSHTAILNAPMSDIVIENNTIKDCISAGIQICNWKNVTISGNTITNCPRGIAVFSVNCNGGESSSANGTFKASYITSKGGTTTDISDSYKEPSDMNIVISNNRITLNNEKDYRGYVHSGILVNGTEYTDKQIMGDESGDIPTGKYHVKGITIKDNTLDATGFGIRCVYADDITITGNKVDTGTTKDKDKDYYGISATLNSSGIKIISNTVSNSPSTGIFVNKGSKGDFIKDVDIKDNVVMMAGDAGIKVTEDNTVVKNVTGNTVVAAKGDISIFVSNKATVNTLTGNTINCPKNDKNAVKVDNISKCSINKDNKVRKFNDVTDTKDFWFIPTYWGAAKDVVKGYNNETEFRPGNECTRGQMVTFMWRLKGCPAPKAKECKFSDVKKSNYFYKAVIWGNENGIVEGYKDGTFGPQKVCQRKHAVTFLWRLAGQPEPSSTKNKFKDVSKSDYFFKATLWASEKGILAGYSDGTFKPDGKCLRRQMVTFLYKYDKFVN
ncbi:MAG: S-layer homology domain-containing protein [Clostridiales bacterium]|nr:S-layer homology domain-containing protein [Clostridiales bacterium]